MAEKDYYNTNKEEGEDLADSRRKAKTQQEIIMDIFMEAGFGVFLSPDRIHEMTTAMGKTWPLTSIRRAMSNLTDAGKLVKTNTMSQGIYGKQVHTWRLKL